MSDSPADNAKIVVVDTTEGQQSPETSKWKAWLEDHDKLICALRSFNWRLVFGVCMWYTLNCVYVVQQKIFLNAIPLHVTLSGVQMILSSIFALIVVGLKLRPAPIITNLKKAMQVFIPIGLCHLLVHYGAVISMGLGAVSFTQVIKSAEPVTTAILSMIILREFHSVFTYLALVPVVAGVSLASVKELDFSIGAFLFALLSNVGSSLRSIFAKVTMDNKIDIGENLTPSNIYMILTVISGVLSIPIVLGAEAYKWKSVWLTHTAEMSAGKQAELLFHAFSSAVCYYLYNDFAFYCLGQMNQVTHSVTNTLKRVLVIVASIIIFRNTVTPLGYVGMAMAVLGAFWYSLVKQGVFSRKPKEAEQVNDREEDQTASEQKV
ncbi:triose phosphate/phosphate translocator, putative [Babesia bigemina]|uniref:Triose phosphate/phosphate translocator, putative n=1 Tax=Babesia bigemina TaxID=5866 RepID=A0A061DBK4_BABBI|nr:triose phosphate/phosphate translocator, putative [Babesia bigemina]CDR98091.1 triose phosphate/phosphate translocator, putative [Babesia bigemina]|eukprot:XP_012770277.1 triose phosphate/phosphate translocator, putative [Babesia bigemina]